MDAVAANHEFADADAQDVHVNTEEDVQEDTKYAAAQPVKTYKNQEINMVFRA